MLCFLTTNSELHCTLGVSVSIALNFVPSFFFLFFFPPPSRWLDTVSAQPLVRTGTQEFRKNFLAKKSCGNSLPGLIKAQGEGVGGGRHDTVTFFSYTFAPIKSLANLDCTFTCFFI